MLYNSASNFTLDDITNSSLQSLNSIEQQLNAMLVELENNPAPSQSDLLVFQANLQLWSNMAQMQSSVTKVYGDSMKQIVNNMG